MYIYSADWLSVPCAVHACYYIFLYIQSHREHNDMCVQCSEIYAVCGHDGVWLCHNKHPFRGIEPKDVSYFHTFSVNIVALVHLVHSQKQTQHVWAAWNVFLYIGSMCLCVCVGRIAERQWLRVKELFLIYENMYQKARGLWFEFGFRLLCITIKTYMITLPSNLAEWSFFVCLYARRCLTWAAHLYCEYALKSIVQTMTICIKRWDNTIHLSYWWDLETYLRLYPV